MGKYWMGIYIIYIIHNNSLQIIDSNKKKLTQKKRMAAPELKFLSYAINSDW